MIRIRSTALPAAITLILFTGACQDAPSSPRSPSAPANVHAPEAQSSFVHVYSGRSADLVANEILSAWSLYGHPEYLAERKAARKGLHLGSDAGAGGPSRVLVDGGQQPPLIIQHGQGFIFGQAGGAPNIPSLLTASMDFVGAHGRIDAQVTVSGSGASYPYNKTLADGAGQVSCTDVLLGSCQSAKHMEGSLVINAGPYCDARATGSATFTADNSDVSIGVGGYAPLSTGAGGYNGVPAVIVAPIQNSSGSCSTITDGGGSAGGGAGGDAPPTWPAPQPAPPAYPAAPPTEFHCETYSMYKAGVLESEVTACYPD